MMLLLSFLFSWNLTGSLALESSIQRPTPNPKQLKTIPGIDTQGLRTAWNFFNANKEKLKLSKKYLAIADFTKKSTEKRLAVINLKTWKADFYLVSHGQGSDPNHDLVLDKFSNKKGSHSTPQGFHRMTTTYIGKHGLSLKMEGLEEENKNSKDRAIVLHAADYVSWKHPGRSHGCPAVEKKHLKKLIEQLKGGALFYHFKK